MLRDKSIFTFGVGDPTGPRSAIWVVWADDPRQTSRATSDVYVVARSLFGTFKASLHASGECHIGLTQEHMRSGASPRPAGRNRHLLKWTRPPLEPHGVAVGLRILFPSNGLRPAALDQSSISQPITWLSDPGPDRAIEVVLLFTAPGKRELEVKDVPANNSRELGVAPLKNGENLVLLGRELAVLPEMQVEIDRAFSRIATVEPTSVSDDPGVRAQLFVRLNDGVTGIVDTAWPREYFQPKRSPPAA